MKTETPYTIYFKNVDKFQPVDGKSQEVAIHTFECLATDHGDAVRQFKMSRRYTIDGRTHFKRFRVVRVFTGDGVGHCTCGYCRVHPDMSRKVRVLKSKMPGWMKKSFSSK